MFSPHLDISHPTPWHLLEPFTEACGWCGCGSSANQVAIATKPMAIPPSMQKAMPGWSKSMYPKQMQIKPINKDVIFGPKLAYKIYTFGHLACTCLSRKRLQTWWEDRAPNVWWQARLCGVGSPWWWGGNPPFYAECKCSASWGSQKKGCWCWCCGCDWHGQMQLKKAKVGGWSCPFKQQPLQPEAPPNCVRSNSGKRLSLAWRSELSA